MKAIITLILAVIFIALCVYAVNGCATPTKSNLPDGFEYLTKDTAIEHSKFGNDVVTVHFRDFDSMAQLAFGFRDKVFLVNGVESVSHGSYYIMVTKGDLYTWDEVLAGIKDVFDEFLEFQDAYKIEDVDPVKDGGA